MAIDFNDPTLVKIVQDVARSVSSHFPSYVSRNDTEQDIWLWVLRNKRSISKLIREHESWEPMVRATITKVANSSALKEDAAVNGYSSDDTYNYTTATIKRLLPDVFDHEDWQSFATFGDGMPKAKGLVNETGDRMAMLADIKKAVDDLPEEQYNLIVWVYKYKESWVSLGEILGCSDSTARDRTRRAVEAIRKYLGKVPLTDLQNSGTRARRAFGNAEANAITERNYEG